MHEPSIFHVFRCVNGDWPTPCWTFPHEHEFVKRNSFSLLHEQYCQYSSQKWMLVSHRLPKWRIKLIGKPMLQNPRKAILWKVKIPIKNRSWSASPTLGISKTVCFFDVSVQITKPQWLVSNFNTLFPACNRRVSIKYGNTTPDWQGCFLWRLWKDSAAQLFLNVAVIYWIYMFS